MENVGSAGSDAVSQREITSQGLTHDGSMVLVYMLTEWGYMNGINVTIYGSTMDPVGYYLIYRKQIM